MSPTYMPTRSSQRRESNRANLRALAYSSAIPPGCPDCPRCRARTSPENKPALTAFPQPAPAHSFNKSSRQSEVDLCAELIPACIRSDAARFAEVRVRLTVSLQAGIVLRKVHVIQRVEDVQRETNPRIGSTETRQILSDPHVEVLVGERARYGEAASLEHWTEALAPSIERVLPAQRHQSRPLDPEQPRHVCGPVRHNAMLLVVRR